MPFDIPQIETTRIHNLLLNKLNKIIEQDESATKMFDADRWGRIFYRSMSSYFGDLRSVYRYTSTLSFHFNILKGKSAFEVNPVDLMAIECLRVFEPDVYKEIARSKKLFTTNGSDRYRRDKDSTVASIDIVLDKASSDKRESVRKMIKQLFPTLDWALGGMEYSGSSAKNWLKEMRICYPSNFDKYFQFAIPSDELSNSELQEMLSLTADSDRFSSFILSLKERDILVNALSQFEAFIDEIPLGNGSSYVKGILDVGDHIDAQSMGFMTFSATKHAEMLISGFLQRIDSQEERGKLLLECFRISEGLSVIEHMLQSEENYRERFDTGCTLRDDDFEALKVEFVKRLDEMSINSPNDLLSNEHLVSFLYRWKRWGNESIVTDWLKSQIQTVEGCITLLKNFVSKSSSHSLDSHIVKTATYIKLENIEDFLEISPIREKVKDLNADNLDPESREALEAFQNALEKREQGTTNDL